MKFLGYLLHSYKVNHKNAGSWKILKIDLAAHCLQNDLKIKKSPLPPPPYKTAVSCGENKDIKMHGSTTEQEMKNNFITEMMWEILYVGNVQFPKIEAGQNHFNNLRINIVAFFLTQSGQQRLFKAAEDKCQTDLVPAVESVLPVMPQRQWNWHRTTKGYLKNYFFQITRKLKSMSSQVFSVLLEQFDYLNYVEFFGWIFQISVGTWYISFTPFSSFKTILFIMLTVSTWTQMLYMKQRSYGSDQPSLSIFNLMWTKCI